MESFKEILLTQFNVTNYRVNGDELWMPCLNPAHTDRHPTNFSINLKTGKAFCFACNFSANVITLLVNRGLSYDRASVIWKQISDAEELTVIPNYSLDQNFVDQYLKNGPSQYALDRTKNPALLKKYNVCSDAFGNTAFLIKSLEQEWKALWIKEKDQYLLVEPLQSKAYGDFFGEHLTPTEYTVLTEGFFDAMYVHQITGLKTICANGTYLSAAQKIKLKRMAPIIVFTDFDDMGRLARDRLHDILADVESYFCGGKYQNIDPDELTPEQLMEVINKKKSWIEYLTIRSNRNVKYK